MWPLSLSQLAPGLKSLEKTYEAQWMGGVGKGKDSQFWDKRLSLLYYLLCLIFLPCITSTHVISELFCKLSSRPPGCKWFRGTHLKGVISCGCSVSLSASWVKQIRWLYGKPGEWQKWKSRGKGRWLFPLSHAVPRVPPFWCYCAGPAALSCLPPPSPQAFFTQEACVRNQEAANERLCGFQAGSCGRDQVNGYSCGRVCHFSGVGGELWHTWWLSLSHNLTSSNFILSQPLGHL